MDEYFDRFGESFPTVPLMWGRTDEQVIELIDECLSKGKDVYELGYVDIDEDVKY